MINKNAIKAVFEGSLKLKSSESCLIVTDTIKEPIGRAFYEYAKRMSSRADIVVMFPTKEHAAEPPKEISDKMLQYDVQILVTEKSLTHTRARIAATNNGARIATMPTITEEIANRCLDIDYEDLRRESQKMYNILKGVKTVRVTTALGTDITFSIGKSDFFGKNGGSFDRPGAFGNLPEGEVAFAPETCEGIFIVDGSFADMGVMISPLEFRVSEGFVTDISGENAFRVRERLDAVGRAAYKIAELGIGLNPKARISGSILEDEKVIGTVHVAVGNNLSFGGDNDVPLHLDGVIMSPDMYVGGIKIMKKGKFLQHEG